MIKVTPVCPDVRVCPGCPASRSRAKVSRESLVSLGSPGLQATPDPKERAASTGSQEWPDPEETTALPVYLVIPESLVVPVVKVFPESLTDIQAAPEPKASPESQVSPAAEGWTELEETTGSQEVRDTAP